MPLLHTSGHTVVPKSPTILKCFKTSSPKRDVWCDVTWLIFLWQWCSLWWVPYQSTEQIHGLQHQLLVSDPRHTQRQQLLVGHPEQLLPVHLLLLEGRDVLLQAVVQTWKTENTTHWERTPRTETRERRVLSLDWFVDRVHALNRS